MTMAREKPKVIRCTECGKRIRQHHSDLEVLEVSSGHVRYYHADRCAAAAYDAARKRGGAYVATYRHVEESTN
jgi:ribosomal protein L32